MWKAEVIRKVVSLERELEKQLVTITNQRTIIEEIRKLLASNGESESNSIPKAAISNNLSSSSLVQSSAVKSTRVAKASAITPAKQTTVVEPPRENTLNKHWDALKATETFIRKYYVVASKSKSSTTSKATSSPKKTSKAPATESSGTKLKKKDIAAAAAAQNEADKLKAVALLKQATAIDNTPAPFVVQQRYNSQIYGDAVATTARNSIPNRPPAVKDTTVTTTSNKIPISQVYDLSTNDENSNAAKRTKITNSSSHDVVNPISVADATTYLVSLRKTSTISAKMDALKSMNMKKTDLPNILEYGGRVLLFQWLSALESDTERMQPNTEEFKTLLQFIHLLVKILSQASWTEANIIDHRFDKVLRKLYKNLNAKNSDQCQTVTQLLTDVWSKYRMLYKGITLDHNNTSAMVSVKSERKSSSSKAGSETKELTAANTKLNNLPQSVSSSTDLTAATTTASTTTAATVPKISTAVVPAFKPIPPAVAATVSAIARSDIATPTQVKTITTKLLTSAITTIDKLEACNILYNRIKSSPTNSKLFLDNGGRGLFLHNWLDSPEILDSTSESSNVSVNMVKLIEVLVNTLDLVNWSTQQITEHRFDKVLKRLYKKYKDTPHPQLVLLLKNTWEKYRIQFVDVQEKTASTSSVTV